MECAPEDEFAAVGPNERNSPGQVAATLAIESETAGTVNDVGFGCSGGFASRGSIRAMTPVVFLHDSYNHPNL
jgi:hypothetical protein